jgi:hypothetical protein
MGWVNDCVELSLALAKWARQRYQSGEWKKKLEQVSTDLLREDVDLRTAEETLKLAHQAGYAGPEVDTVQERIDAIRAYEKKRAKPPRTPATKMRKKKAAPKPTSKRKTPARKRKGSTKRGTTRK